MLEWLRLCVHRYVLQLGVPYVIGTYVLAETLPYGAGYGEGRGTDQTIDHGEFCESLGAWLDAVVVDLRICFLFCVRRLRTRLEEDVGV